MEVDLRVDIDVLIAFMSPIVIIYDKLALVADLQLAQPNRDIKLLRIFERIDAVKALEHVWVVQVEILLDRAENAREGITVKGQQLCFMGTTFDRQSTFFVVN